MFDPKEFLSDAKQMKPQLIEWRRSIHRHPEIGLSLPHTAALVSHALTEIGLSPQHCGTDGTTGIIALIEGSRPGPTLLLRADMDALPLTEEASFPVRHICVVMTHIPPCCWVQRN